MESEAQASCELGLWNAGISSVHHHSQHNQTAHSIYSIYKSCVCACRTNRHLCEAWNVLINVRKVHCLGSWKCWGQPYVLPSFMSYSHTKALFCYLFSHKSSVKDSQEEKQGKIERSSISISSGRALRYVSVGMAMSLQSPTQNGQLPCWL